MAKNRTYYGEYSLKRWIDLLIKGNIFLPEYQRHFVWDERDVKRLIKSIKSGQFIQPVTIGLYKQPNGENCNLLLDGQQRLTSILLAYLGYFPIKEKFESRENEIATDDDSALDDIEKENNIRRYQIKWTIRELCERKTTIQDLKEVLSSDQNYSSLTLENKLDEKFWETNFIGFSYIVPNCSDDLEIQKFYTHLFRNINYYGQKLSAYESRKSLYYQNPKYTNYLEGKTNEGKDVLCNLTVIQDFQPKQIDFIRYLSVLSQKVEEKVVMVGYSAYKIRESFYADYVAYLLGLEQEDRDDKFNGFNFDTTFPDSSFEDRYTSLQTAIETIKPHISLDDKNNSFKSWIDADFWLFGLIYFIVFKGQNISLTEENVKLLKENIEEKIKSKDDAYQKRSNALGNLRERINESINIYKTYVS